MPTKKKKEETYSEDQIEELLNRGWDALDKAFTDLIEGCKIQHMDLVVDSLILTKKIAGLYRKAQLAQFNLRKANKDAE